MRITGGTLKGRKLSPFKGDSIRPTADAVKEAIFNILQNSLCNKNVLDIFAGTGAFGIDALSHGALNLVMIENAPYSLKIIKKNIELCSIKEKVTLINQSVKKGISILKATGWQFDIIFMDPPYNKGLVAKTLSLIDSSGLLNKGGVVVVEHSYREKAPDDRLYFRFSMQKKYKEKYISFYDSILK